MPERSMPPKTATWLTSGTYKHAIHSLGISLCIALSISLPSRLQAQIASPSNAGGNAGNNSSGSTNTPISTPTFTPIILIPAAESITISTEGSVTTVTASPLIMTSVTTAVSNTTAANSLLAPVVNGSAPTMLALNNASPVDIVLTPSSGPRQQPNTVSQLVDQVATFIGQGQGLTVSSLTMANMGTITPSGDGLLVNIAGQEINIQASANNQSAVSQFAAIAIVSGLSASSLSIGASLVNLGADPVQVSRLMIGLQGLATVTELTSLSTGIDAFNNLVLTTNASTLQAISSLDTFLAARITLMAARTAIGS